MALYMYAGPPGGHYSYLRTRRPAAPFTGLQPGDVVDYGDADPPDDERWVTAKSTAAETRLPDNHLPLAPVFSDAPAPPTPQRRTRPTRGD